MKISASEYKKIFQQRSHKYRAKKTVVDGITFDSKKEANFYRTLKLWKEDGEVKYFLRQVPFHLPGKVKYIVDFLVVWNNGNIEYIDVKGYDTHLSKAKRKQVEDLYPVKIFIA